MTEPLRIQVDRARPTCPYCKAELVGGHAWLCPGCAAAHHAECAREHGRCATCGRASAKEAADETLARLATALAARGFALVREDEDGLVGLHPAFQTTAFTHPTATAVQVVRLAELTEAALEDHVSRRAADPLAACDTVVLFAADRVAPDARERLRSAPPVLARGAARVVPVAWAGEELVLPPSGLFTGFALHEAAAREVVAAFAAPPIAGAPRTVAPPRALSPEEAARGLAVFVAGLLVAVLLAVLTVVLAGGYL